MKRLELFLALLLVAALVSACVAPVPGSIESPAPAAVEEAPVAPTEAPPSAEPSVIRFPLGGDPSSLEPALVSELYAGWISENLHATLLMYDDNNELVPYLAESYELSDDGLTYTFHLRGDIKFHNGRAIVANDFKSNWERYLDPMIAAQTGGDYLSGIVGAGALLDGTADTLEGMTVLDDQTFTVTTERPDPGFLQRLASPLMAAVPPEAVVDGQPEWVDNPVGAGPFKFVEWKVNQRIVLEAWDDFFLGRPTVDRIEYYIVPDAATALAQYEAGELDVVDVTYSDLARVRQDPTLSEELNSWTRARLVFYCPSMDKVDAFKDKRVRQALNYALNRDSIIENLLFDALQPAKGFVPPSMPEYNPDLQGYGYDPEKARELLAEAGYPEGQGFPSLKLNSTADLSTELEAVAAQWNENLGIPIEVEIVERGELFSGWFAHATWDVFRWGWSADFPSAEIWLHQLLSTGVSGNCSGYSNPEFDAIVDEARTTLDDAKRAALWQQAEEIAMEDAPMIPFGYDQYHYLVKPNVEGFQANYHGPIWFKNIAVGK